ncbi:MAG: PilZ domain-containing protein [Deltaproteobacteria bacterium]|nr:PilZ domain-containing protein [Deltaproteobacteria bacterium]MBW1906682.1 PilZ domain-containing protein [Deltaproteobacteria bacterium]MBW2160974.1 PilZ domain-containing protein [Deltaproteobacteria bacterium]
MTQTPTQQRQHDRYLVRISCELTISGQTLHAEMKNLSTGGAAIVVTQPLTVGEVVTVSFFLTQDGIEDAKRQPFEGAASIRWLKPAGDRMHEAGLQFLSPSKQQRELVGDFLRQTA